MAEQPSNPLQPPLPSGVVPETVVARTEERWVAIMGSMLGIMMVIIVMTGVTNALHPPSNVEVVDPQTLHLNGEFVESNLGTAFEPACWMRARALVSPRYALRLNVSMDLRANWFL